jgi:hypothetical protein
MNRTTLGAHEHHPPAPPGTGAMPDARATPDTRRAGRWLGVARAAWAVAAILALGVLLTSIPGYGLAASQGYWAGRPVEAPAGFVHALDLAGALASFASALVCLVLSGLLFWRKPSDRMALFVSFYLLVYGIVQAGPLERLEPLVPGVGALATDILQPLFAAPSLALLALFPNGRFVPRWSRWLVLLAALLSLLWLPLAWGAPAQWWADPTNWLTQAYGALAVLGLGAALYMQAYRYRRVSSPIERQQAKWVASGVVCQALLAGASNVVAIMGSRVPAGAAFPWWMPVGSLLWWLSLDSIPLALTIAVLRFRLFDLDVLIRLTLVYGTLTATLAGIYVGFVVAAQSVVRGLTGERGEQPVVIVASTLLVVALSTPLRRRLQAGVDRRFYRRKYDAERTLAAFGATLRQEVDLERLQERLLAVVEETVQPAHVSLWLRAPCSGGTPDVRLLVPVGGQQ